MQITISLFVAFLAGWYVRRKAHDIRDIRLANAVRRQEIQRRKMRKSDVWEQILRVRV